MTHAMNEPRSVAEIIRNATAQYDVYAQRGIEWAFGHLSAAERDAFDRWLVRIGHVLASEPGTQERRFKSFVTDLASGLYKGELP